MSLTEDRIALELAGRDPSSQARWTGQRPKRVAVKGDWVMWDYLYTEGPFGPGEPEAGFGFPEIPTAPPFTEGHLALLDFLKLADGSANDVRAFIANWGALDLCRHGLPASHWPLESDAAPRLGPRCLEADGDGAHGRDLIKTIRAWSRMCRATLRLGLELVAGENSLGRREDWNTLGTYLPANAHDANERLSDVLNAWLGLGLVWVQVDLLASPRLRLTASGPFGIIARELVRAVMNSTMAICNGCTEPFEPSRAPRWGEDTYCAKTQCKGIARARASKRSRQRTRRLGNSLAEPIP